VLRLTGGMLETRSSVGSDRGVVSTTGNNTPPIVFPSYAVSESKVITKVNTIAPSARFKTSD